MYNSFFDFKEKPFRLVPNPAYLYLSASHEEVMASLLFAVSHGEGFVEVTGEVGTGKTTICRTFLDRLGEETEVAYIFNPKLDSIQLLKSIHDEFGITAESADTKSLIDALNVFLLDRNAKGKNVILLIDEAQNMTKELLEQLRLLSNLETNTSKLLQIILVGQPELHETLNSYELRQLCQRITLNCRLRPLTFRETKEYIEHRLRVASNRLTAKFSQAAIRHIYGYSKGYPRTINIACDRCLLAAFGADHHLISGSIAKGAIRELESNSGFKHFSLLKRFGVIAAGLVVCLLLILATYFYPTVVDYASSSFAREGNSQVAPEGIGTQESSAFKNASAGPDGTDPEPGPGPDPGQGNVAFTSLEQFLKKEPPKPSRRLALVAAADLWGATPEEKSYLENMSEDEAFFRLAAEQIGLQLRDVKWDLSLVRQINLPAILELYEGGGLSPHYLTVYALEQGRIYLTNKNVRIKTSPEELETYWTGRSFILWKNFYNIDGTPPYNSSGNSILSLKLLLQDIGFPHLDITEDYDDRTKDAIIAIQKKYGIAQDGVVGSTTKIALYNEKKSLFKPHISR